MTATVIPLRDFDRPQREAPAEPAKVVPLPKRKDPDSPYAYANLGTGWPPTDMIPPSDVS